MEGAVLRRAEALGLTNGTRASEALLWARGFLLADLGVETLPEALWFVEEDMAVGYLLQEAVAAEAAGVKSIAEGDISVSFGDVPSGRVALAGRLLRPPPQLLAAHRRLTW